MAWLCQVKQQKPLNLRNTMFSDLFKLTQKPVRVFSSTDKDAPVLTAAAGSLKTLLKACLITGYGDKTALGWQLKYESDDKNSAVFVSQDPTSAGYHLKIDNTDAIAKISAYYHMTSIDEGDKPLAQGLNYHTHITDWRLIGHEKAFILLVHIMAKHQDETYFALPLVFGDLPKQSSRIAPLCVLWCGYYNNVSSYLQGVGGLQSTLWQNPLGQSALSDSKTEHSALCYPVYLSQHPAPAQKSYCRFDHKSFASSILLFEPPLMALEDGTWTFLPMLMPLSTRAEVGNLAMLNDTMMLARTGHYVCGNNNNDCAVPTNWWWA